MTDDSKIDFRLTPLDGGQGVRLETFVDEASVSWVELGAEGLDALIADLAAARAELTQPVAEAFDPATAPPPTEDPAWWVADPDPQGIGLALRHPGLGWLGFYLPKDEALQMARWLGGGA
jgi:hypothetical protein